MLRTVSLRNSFLATIVAVSGSFSVWAGDAALISALEGNKLCTATLENATWTPMLGETIPEKTGLEIGPESKVNLVHFGTNSEVTLLAGSRVTVLMKSIEGLSSDTTQAALENMPQGLDLEARHQQQVGAVNMQHMPQASARKQAPGAALKSSIPPLSFDEGAAAPAPAPLPVPAPSVPPQEQMSEAVSAAPQAFETQSEAMPTRGGSPANKGIDFADMITDDAMNKNKSVAAKERESSMLAASGQSTALAVQSRILSVAIPADRLNRKIGTLEKIVVEKVEDAFASPEFTNTAVADKPGISTGTWILAKIILPANVATAVVKLNGKNKSIKSINVEFVNKADITVSSAVRYEFQGLPAQAAAVWINLLNQGAVSPEIAAAHLRRLSTAIDAKLR